MSKYRYFTMEFNGPHITYIFNPYTKYEERASVNYFDEIPLEPGDHINYPLDIKDIHLGIEFCCYLPEEVAITWLDHTGIDTPINKLMYVVDVRSRMSSAIYLHDGNYSLYRLRRNEK